MRATCRTPGFIRWRSDDVKEAESGRYACFRPLVSNIIIFEKNRIGNGRGTGSRLSCRARRNLKGSPKIGSLLDDGRARNARPYMCAMIFSALSVAFGFGGGEKVTRLLSSGLARRLLMSAQSRIRTSFVRSSVRLPSSFMKTSYSSAGIGTFSYSSPSGIRAPINSPSKGMPSPWLIFPSISILGF